MSTARLHADAEPPAGDHAAPASGQRSTLLLPPAGGRRAGAPASVLHLQRLAGNRAVAGLLSPERHGDGSGRQPGDVTSAGPVLRPSALQRCGLVPASRCGCHGPSHGVDQRAAEDGGSTPVQRVSYATTHTCGVKESARIFSSWAVAVAKLSENLPALELSYATGLATPNLKNNLLRHFKVAKNDKVQRKRVLGKLIRGYHWILLKMTPGLGKVRCGGTSCAHNDYAYTNSGSNNSTIWLCNVEFSNRPILDLAATWIHELSHSLFDTDDNGYYTYTGSATLATTNECLNEADCWGNFMVSYT